MMLFTRHRRLSYPERMVFARERRGLRLLVYAAVTGVTAVTLTTVSVVAAAAAAAAALALALRARRQFALARRAEIGVQSERQTDSALNQLRRRHDWEIAANVVFPGRGDIDHVITIPGGPHFAIETKTSRYDRRHLKRTLDAARYVSTRSRPATPTVAILTTAAKRRTTVENGVIVCWTRNLANVIEGECSAHHAHRDRANDVAGRATDRWGYLRSSFGRVR